MFLHYATYTWMRNLEPIGGSLWCWLTKFRLFFQPIIYLLIFTSTSFDSLPNSVRYSRVNMCAVSPSKLNAEIMELLNKSQSANFIFKPRCHSERLPASHFVQIIFALCRKISVWLSIASLFLEMLKKFQQLEVGLLFMFCDSSV